MSIVATGLASAGIGILASSAGSGFAAGLLALATAVLALVFFATDPQPFASVLTVAMGAATAWLVMPSDRRRAAVLAAGGAGLLCAAATPHLAVLLTRLPLEAEASAAAVRLAAALVAMAIGAGMAGLGGAGFAVLGFAFELGLLAQGTPMCWLIPSAVVAALFVARHSEPAGAAALALAASLAIWEA